MPLRDDMQILSVDDHLVEHPRVFQDRLTAARREAGPRVIEQTIRQKLPPGFQRSEFLLEHGMLDAVVPRKQLKPYIARALEFMVA